MAKNKKRTFLKIGVVAWTTPIISSISLPAHAETSVCVSSPVIPPAFPDVTIGDNAGGSIDDIDISIYGQCSITSPVCTEYTATGLPPGLSISSSGIITGSYNATGTEVFTVQLNAVLCEENVPVGNFTLTITDEG